MNTLRKEILILGLWLLMILWLTLLCCLLAVPALAQGSTATTITLAAALTP